MTMLEIAKKYKDMGISVIPVSQNKKPLIAWQGYQKKIASDAEIEAWWTQTPAANIGAVTGQVSGLAVIDIDTAEGDDAIQAYLPESLVTPISKTPKGKHYFFKYPEGLLLPNNVRKITGCDFRGEGGYVILPPSVNVEGKKYEWIIKPSKTPFAELPEKYIELLRNNSKQLRNNSKQSETIRNRLFQEGRRDNDLFNVSKKLLASGMPLEEVEQVLLILAAGCNPPFPAAEVKMKLLSAANNFRKKEVNSTEEIEKWIALTEGQFSVTDCWNENKESVKNKNTVRALLNRFKDRGMIERSGKDAGVFRRVENVCDTIDYISATNEGLNLKYPFQIENYVKTHPKNIIIVAGSSNSGKTAFLLNFAAMNMEKFKINYFSSEMGGIELKERLSKFSSFSLSDFQAVKWFERSANFADIIKPDDINIIDFLEVTDNFYLVAQYIKDIFDKLQKGVAIIAIQKNAGQNLGVGGARSLEKARLYLSMDAGKIRIEKGKNWTDATVNPNGLERSFKLVQGCHFVSDDLWRKGEK